MGELVHFHQDSSAVREDGVIANGGVDLGLDGGEIALTLELGFELISRASSNGLLGRVLVQGVPKLLHLHQILDVSAVVLVDLLDAFISALVVNFLLVVIIADVVVPEVIIRGDFLISFGVNQEIFLIGVGVREERLATRFADASLGELTHAFEVIHLVVVVVIVVVEVRFVVISVSIGAHFVIEGSEIRRRPSAILKSALAAVVDISVGLELDFPFSLPIAVGLARVGLRVLGVRPVGVTGGHLRLPMLGVRILE